MAVLRYNVYPIRQPPSVDRGARGADEDRSGPATCEGCGHTFWSWDDLGRCWHCDGCRPRPLPPPPNGRPKAGTDDAAWVSAARRDEEALARSTHEKRRIAR
jgi:hypothetical protein